MGSLIKAPDRKEPLWTEKCDIQVWCAKTVGNHEKGVNCWKDAVIMRRTTSSSGGSWSTYTKCSILIGTLAHWQIGTQRAEWLIWYLLGYFNVGIIERSHLHTIVYICQVLSGWLFSFTCGVLIWLFFCYDSVVYLVIGSYFLRKKIWSEVSNCL